MANVIEKSLSGTHWKRPQMPLQAFQGNTVGYTALYWSYESMTNDLLRVRDGVLSINYEQSRFTCSSLSP